MNWVCPKCRSKLEGLKCKKCNFEAKIQNSIFDFTFDLSQHERAEDRYRQKEKLDVQEILAKKSGTINYFFKNIKDKLQVQGKVLDIGAGYCWLSGLLSKNSKVEEIWSSDVSMEALKIGQKIAELKSYEILGYIRAKADHLPFSDHYFDSVVSSAFLHHVQSVPKILSEIKRVIKPGGTYYAFLEPASFFLFKPIYKLKTKKAKLDHPGVLENIYTFGEWEKFFRQYGFSFVLIPPEHEKWYSLWKFFKTLGLIRFLFFSNILIKVKF